MTPPSGDGRTPATAAWAPAMFSTPGTTKTYVVDGLGTFPRYKRTTVADARSWAQVYTILDGDTYQVVTQLPPGPMANPSMPEAAAIAEQTAAIVAHEHTVATGGGTVAAAYNAQQAHHGDAYASSDPENDGNSSDEGADSRSSPTSGSGSNGGASSTS
ncbi:uncharacterized protein K460DRAFT_345404 [Cucurbitaria berberidis CBS 394.84]|uniref:Uncharacterized protein n=1 Tax=Cucurbitaria berberidis CBS 394.84 TaxID=1168544 RepID=A0A9P4L4X6_9PLEO|nr:uncharacterized protein K460DRAFT_345404 [Cucurbitaria berberidis CBS 394.84]KAF1841985.1 hypothetical protein K460DRAFT_345404 [Cucurbitaria berberidis CBS 394.84]